MESDQGKGWGWGWKVIMVSINDLDRDTVVVDSQSLGISDEYVYDQVTDTWNGGVLTVGEGRGRDGSGVRGGGVGVEGAEGNHVLH